MRVAVHPFQAHAKYGTWSIDFGSFCSYVYLNESCLGFSISDWEDAGRIINGGGRSVWESKIENNIIIFLTLFLLKDSFVHGWIEKKLQWKWPCF